MTAKEKESFWRIFSSFETTVLRLENPSIFDAVKERKKRYGKRDKQFLFLIFPILLSLRLSEAVMSGMLPY